MNRVSADWPGTLMAIKSPLVSLRDRNVVNAVLISSSGTASGWLKILACGM